MINSIYRIVLFGHRNFNAHQVIDEHLYELLNNIIQTKDFVEIYMGRNGEFDLFTATIIKQLQKNNGKNNLEFIGVFPYVTKDIEYLEKYYDKVIIPECVSKTHPKNSITKRNKWMVEQADLFICYVERQSGGAYTALKYAQKLNKEIINLANTTHASIGICHTLL